MKSGHVNEFIEHTSYEECAVLYHDKKYFFHGLIFDQDTNTYTFEVEAWDGENCFINTVFDTPAETAEKCMENFYQAPIFEGKSFWEAEPDMEWIEW